MLRATRKPTELSGGVGLPPGQAENCPGTNCPETPYTCLAGALESLACEAAPGRRPTLSGKTVQSTGAAPPQCARQFSAPTIVEHPSGRSPDGWREPASQARLSRAPTKQLEVTSTFFPIVCVVFVVTLVENPSLISVHVSLRYTAEGVLESEPRLWESPSRIKF